MRSPSTGAAEGASSPFPAAGPSTGRGVGMPVEGLRMNSVFAHEPVMVTEVVDLFAAVPEGVVVDATVGGGGHAEAILRAHHHLAVLGLDRDPEAVQAAARRLATFGNRATVLHSAFADLADTVGRVRSGGEHPHAWPQRSDNGDSGACTLPVVGVLFDLGVSSPQLDRPERGFSYRQGGTLDMRMDPNTSPNAAELVNQLSTDELAALLVRNGEGRMARRIARAIVAARPLESTDQLASVVAAAVPAPGRRRGHPARRVFQALRIEVNQELEQLLVALPQALQVLAVAGRLLAISYHSGEDRLVKQAFRDAVTGGCTCPPGLPCTCGAQPQFQLLFSGSHRPSVAEIGRNHRAESARLRAIERVTAEADRS